MVESHNILLNENPVHLVYARKSNDGSFDKILKQLNSAFPSNDLISQLKNEFIATQHVNIPGIRKSKAFVQGDGKYVLELEYIEGLDLGRLVEAQTETTKSIIEIISKLCTIIGELHQLGWIHGSISPSNIIISPHTKAPTLIDGTMMTKYSLKASNQFSTEKYQRILPYISPEQTVRTSRMLDHRTDFYSLGITLYEILVGIKPFTSKNPLELIYAHLARLPLEPERTHAHIPKKLSQVIMKLLAKNAEDRYQSAQGLKYDLDRIVENWSTRDQYHFKLGEQDFNGKLQIPQKLFGREKEIELLLENLHLTLQGERRAVFISGISGTGKSALVKEVLTPITESKGFYLKGKFDQFVGNIPYSAWIEIFRDFINQLLTTDEVEIDKWRVLLEDALGNGIGVLGDLIPNLKFIVRNMPNAENLGITQTQNRLNNLLNVFFRSISTSEHPITVFIDDLQWADNASLNLLKTLIADVDCKYLLIIGAYRSEDLIPNQAFHLKLSEIAQLEVPIAEIKLNNLNKSQISEIISETLLADVEHVAPLTQVAFSKTQGNPYFTNQFLNSIYNQGLLTFNWDKSIQSKRSIWDWDLTQINATSVSSNVVDLLVHKILELPNEVVEILKSASCIGNSFGVINLSNIRKAEVNALVNLLEKAVDEGYIFYKNLSQLHSIDQGSDVEYQFSHDQVQQAFHTLIPEDEGVTTHFEIGKQLHHSLEEDEITKQIFQLVFHLNIGAHLVSDRKEAVWLAKLNLKASKEAKRIIAFDAAHQYISLAKELCGDAIWTEDEGLAIQIGEEYLDCTYLTNRFDEAEAYFEFLKNRMSDPIKKAELCYRRMIQYQHLSKIDGILDIGLEGLSLLGLQFNAKASKFKLLTEIAKTYFAIRGKTDEELRTLPLMTDPASKMAMSLMYKSLTFAYDRSEELMAILGMKLMQMTLKQGLHDFSTAGYSTYGGVLSVGFNQHEKSISYSRIAIHGSNRIGNKAAMAMAHFGLAMTGYPILTFKEALAEFQTSLDLAVEVGSYTDAAPSTMYFFFLNFINGERLDALKQIVLDNLYFTDRIKTENFHLILLAGLGVIDELKNGPKEEIETIKNEQLATSELEKRLVATEHKSIRIYARIFQMHNHILFQRYDAAKQCEREVLAVMNVTLGTVLGPYFHYLQAILYGRLYKESNHSEQRRIRRLFKKVLRQLQMLERHCAGNYAHWNLLIKAEKARIELRFDDAQKLYDQSIEASRTGNYVHEQALGNYLCSRFNDEVGNIKIAEFYLTQAAQAYRSWGADAAANAISYGAKNLGNYLQNSTFNINSSLDQETLIKFSELISGEIEFDKLIQKLMTVFTENAGAEKAVIIMKSDDKWFIEAAQRKREDVRIERIEMIQEGLEETMVPISVCQYVMRTKTTIILEDACFDNRFAKSSYIKKHQVQSILCMPLIKKGELTGLVYLENNMMAGAFKTGRTQLLNYISSQVAVSVDNAKLYSDMRSLNWAYERFVPKEFLNILGKKSITEVNLGDQVQMNMTVLFSDIRNFTGMSERMSPAENFQFINDYLSRMVPIIRKHNGFVDKYIGDEIMALFPTNADDAIQCGIAMMHELRVYGDVLKKKGLDPIRIGIGMNSGSLMLGTVGGTDRMNSTVISDTVNLASRVENSTKETGAPFMITKAMYDQLKDPSKYALRALGKRIFRGKSEATVIFEVFEGEDFNDIKLKRKTKETFEKAVELFDHDKLRESLELFRNVLKANPNDIPASKYLKDEQQNLN